MPADKSSTFAAVNILFIEIFENWSFQIGVVVEAFAAANAYSVWIRRSPR